MRRFAYRFISLVLVIGLAPLSPEMAFARPPAYAQLAYSSIFNEQALAAAPPDFTLPSIHPTASADVFFAAEDQLHPHVHAPFQDITRTPAWRFLAILGLENALRLPSAASNKRPTPGGGTVVQVTIPEFDSFRNLKSGFRLLPHELGPEFRTFDLLYNRQGLLIAIFPANPSIELQRSARSIGRAFKYFNLAPYYMEVPRFGEAGAAERWDALERAVLEDAAEIDGYVLSSRLFYQAVNNIPYYIAEVNASRSHIAITAVSLGNGANPFRPSRVSQTQVLQRVLVPLLPTVFKPAISTDKSYYQRLAGTRFFNRSGIRSGDTAWVVGCGSGFDSWMVALTTKREVYASDFNPFAILNTQILAELAGFKVHAVVSDNIADVNGQTAFPNLRFDWVFWNMPKLDDEPQPAVRPFAQSHDGDPDALIFQRFTWYLRDVLKPYEGRARIWNTGEDRARQILAIADAAHLAVDIEDLASHYGVYLLSPKPLSDTTGTRLGKPFQPFWPVYDFSARKDLRPYHRDRIRMQLAHGFERLTQFAGDLIQLTGWLAVGVGGLGVPRFRWTQRTHKVEKEPQTMGFLRELRLIFEPHLSVDGKLPKILPPQRLQVFDLDTVEYPSSSIPRLWDIQHIVHPGFDNVFVIPPGQFALLQVDPKQREILFSPGHAVCSSLSLRAIASDGTLWIGHAHLHPLTTDRSKRQGFVFEQLTHVLTFLKSQHFIQVDIVFGNNGWYKGLPDYSIVEKVITGYGFHVHTEGEANWEWYGDTLITPELAAVRAIVPGRPSFPRAEDNITVRRWPFHSNREFIPNRRTLKAA